MHKRYGSTLFVIIVNNAGYTWDGVIHKMSDKMWDAMIDVKTSKNFYS